MYRFYAKSHLIYYWHNNWQIIRFNKSVFNVCSKKVQSAVDSLFGQTFLGKWLNMNYANYKCEKENKVFQSMDRISEKLLHLFESREQRINLSDPQKRLEESQLF